MSSFIRDEIEKTIKEFTLDRSCFHEVSKNSYSDILKKIEKTFVLYGGTIHWSNIQNRFNPKLSCRTKSIGNNYLWFEHLPYIIPNIDMPFYVLFEDSKNMEPKYWVYEAYLKEFTVILKETQGIGDYYLVSKKMDWLISECHEDVVCFIGENLNLHILETI